MTQTADTNKNIPVVERLSREDLIRAVAESPEAMDDIPDSHAGFLGGDANAPIGADDDEVLAVSRGNRTPRDAETRVQGQREAPTWLPRASLPDPKPEPGYVFRYVRIGYGKGNQDDISNVMGRMREGWRVVHPDEQPEIAATLPNGGKGSDRIVIGEVMLVKAPKEMVEQRTAYYSRQSKLQSVGVQSQLLKVQDARMPMLRPSIVSETSKKLV